MTDGLLPLDQGLFGRLRRDAGAAWDDYVGHDFVRALGRGTLPEAAFRHFLIQDYLFLIHFARAHALAGFKATQLADIRAAAAAVSTIVDVEMPLHVAYCAGWGLSEEQMAGAPEAIETMAYTRFVLERGLAGDLLDLQVALAPCLVGYGESGERLLADPATRRDGNPYGEWIAAYTSEGYRGAVRDAVALLGLASHLARRHAIRGSSPPSSRRRDWRRRSGTWAGGPGRCRVILETRTHPHPEADVALANGD
jgi:thiaminase/transcriptional activator TenA